MASFITAGMDVTVTTTASTDKVLLTVNLNMVPTQQLSATAYTIFRDSTNLGGTVSMVDIHPRELTESQAATFSFLDSPGPAGTYTYSVYGKYRSILSANNQVRQISALIIPSTIASNKNSASTAQTISSTTPTSLNVDTSVSTSIITDRVLVSASFSINPVSAGAVAKISLFRDGVPVAPYAMQLVTMGATGKNRMGTFFFLDAPNVQGSVTYSLRAAKVGTVDFSVCEGDFDGIQFSTIVVPVVDSVVASSDTALLITSQSWTTCGLSAAIMPHSTLEKVLITVNINFHPTAAGSTGIFTIFRDGINLGDVNYGLQMIKTPAAGETAIATMSFLDSPGTSGQVTYTVQVRALTSDTFTVSFNGQTRQIAVIASRAVAGCAGGCGFPTTVVTAANNRYRRLTLSPFFTLTFGLTLPTLVSGNPNVFDIRDVQTGNSLLAMHRASNTNTRWTYNGANIVENGMPLISGSIGTTPNVVTVYTVVMLADSIKMQSTYQVGVWTTAAITKVDITGRLYDLYLSNAVNVSSLGTISNIGITADAPPPSTAPTRIPTSKPTPTPTTLYPSTLPTPRPTTTPTNSPTADPTLNPTASPTLNPTLYPTINPTINPTVGPTAMPTFAPTVNPTLNPTASPTLNPTLNPSMNPTRNPTAGPTAMPTFAPTVNPTLNPTASPTLNPTLNPSTNPTRNPTVGPTAGPTAGPSVSPSLNPTPSPTANPSKVPSARPTAFPTVIPTEEPSDKPTPSPSVGPTVLPTASPSTVKPTVYPTRTPSVEPSMAPTVQPSVGPTASPSKAPSARPTAFPTIIPTEEPSDKPTPSPSVGPTVSPTASPSATPTKAPTVSPTQSPSVLPYVGPSVSPTLTPTADPTTDPTVDATATPTAAPTVAPSVAPSTGPTKGPTLAPSAAPSAGPTTNPTVDPSVNPSAAPSMAPSMAPSAAPTESPTADPSVSPTLAPTTQPSAAPSANPSASPTASPSVAPTATPSAGPSISPTVDPTVAPSVDPTARPSVDPSMSPTVDPTVAPSVDPTARPSAGPSMSPTVDPTVAPSVDPTASPSEQPSAAPSVGPSVDPSAGPTPDPTAGPSAYPSVAPTTDPTVEPTVHPTAGSTQDPSAGPSTAPSADPTVTPTVSPSAVPTVSPSATPTTQPSDAPTVAPSAQPTVSPSAAPSAAPSVNPTLTPTAAPSKAPTVKPTANPTVQVTDAAGIIVPAVPHLASAVFNNAGSSVCVSFSSATNKAGDANQFACSAILSFTGASTASCVWTDASTITVYPSAATLNVGSTVALTTNNKVKAACPASVSATVCASWSQATATTVSIQAPASPTAPVVVFTASSTLSGCSPWSLDLSSSSGSGGRAWLTPVFTVTTAQGDGSAVAAFLNSGFSFSAPTSVPNALFPTDGVYTISVTLSNFLGASRTADYAVTVTKSSDAYPTVSIHGQDPRSVLTSSALVLTSSAYTIDCTGVKTTTNLAYAWAVSTNGMVQTSLTSESLDTSRFRLSAYRLTPLKTYDILVTVTNTLSDKSSSASVSVAVQQGAVVAQMSGSASQSILVDGSLTLDASSSRDQDVATFTGTAAGLSFSWSCVQSAPEQSSTCPLTLSGTSLQTLTLTAPSTAAGTKSCVTVTVTKGTRTSSATVFVATQDSSAPLIAITTSTQSVTSVNANNRLSLSASVTVQSSCTAEWSVADSSVKLSTSALTPVSSIIPVGSTRVVNLVLAASALPERSSLAFTLACGQSSAAITVTTNGPPLPGLFNVTPATGGIELSTSFAFSATFWSDTDLPITYQFGFVSPSSGATLTVQGRSESSFATTTLAAGSSSAQYAVKVLAKVFDALNAASSATSSVAVNPQTDVTQLRASLSAQLTSSAGSTEGTKNAISVGSTVINAVSCSSAPDCAGLNRAGCAKVQNTCGSCLTGYLGDSGDGNSRCVSATSSGSSDKTAGSACSASDECGGWLACDTSLASPVCYLPSKRCSDDCSGHGTCVPLNANSRKEVASCSAGDSTCVVSCVCDESYSGATCAITSAELLEKQAMRSQYLQSLSNVASTEDADSSSVTALSNSLSSLAQNPYELSAASVTLVNQVANSVLTSAATLGDFSYESAIGVLSAIDAAAAATVRMNSSNTAAFANEMMQTIALFNSLVQSQLVAGQDGVEYIQDSFRMSSIRQLRGFNTSLRILSPTSLLEQSNNGRVSSVTIDAGSAASSGSSRLLSVEVDEEEEEEEFAVDMVVTTASSYGSAGDSFNSNPVQVTVSRTASTPTRVTFVLVHNGAGNFTSREEAASMSLNTTCTGVEDRSMHFYECPGSNEMLSHNCSGLSGVLTSYCPVLAPTCAILDGHSGIANTSSSDCEVLSFDLYSTTCSCLVQPSTEAAVRSRRLSLSELQQTGLLDAVSVTVYMGSEFKNTFNSAGKMDSAADFERVLITIVMFCTLWVGGILLILSCTWRRNLKKKANAKLNAHIEKKVQVAEVSRSPAAVHQYLTDYVIQTFPSVFSNKPFFSRLYGEVKRHHRYLTLFTAPEGESGDKQRILTGVQLLSTQTMLMFLLAMLYDVESPSDDGSCLTFADEESCLVRKSVFDSTVSYCDWTYDAQNDISTCFYRDPKFSLKVILYISVIVAILTAIISYPTDLIFETLSAPVADESKAAAQESVIQKIGQGASNMARRASNVAVSAAAAAKNKVNRNSYVGGTVTRKLPGSTEAAHALATASMTVIAENSRRTIMNRQMTRMRSYQASGGKFGLTKIDGDDYASSSSSSSDSESENDEDNVRGGEIVDKAANTTNDGNAATDKTTAELLAKLSEEVHCQRRLLRPSELEEYDSQWGLDPTGEFTQGERSVVPCLRGRPGAKDSILYELKLVKKQSRQKCEKLNIATDAHTGLEILHLFIIDLLGRDTPAAVIFETKAEEDFQHTKVVTRNTKRLAALALFGINAFFVYYAILTGFRKGVSWQQIYLVACIVQFFVEIFLFETMEVVWINCVIPVLVSDEVRSVGASIIEVVQQLCGDASVESRFFLNAPDYLFVSTNVAKQFPHLMESILVQAYNNHVPGELARKWQTGSIARMHRRNRRRNATLFGTVLRALQFAGTAPFLIHRMMIRFVQPFMLSGLALLWQLIVQDVIYIAVAVFCVLLVLAFALYRRYQEQQQIQKSQNISPIVAQYMSSKTDDVAHYSDEELHLPSVPVLVSMLDRSLHSERSQRSSHSRRSAKSSAGLDFSDSNDAHSFHQEPRRRLDADPAVPVRRPSLSSSELSSTELSSAAPVRRHHLRSYASSELSEEAKSVSDESATSSEGADVTF